MKHRTIFSGLYVTFGFQIAFFIFVSFVIKNIVPGNCGYSLFTQYRVYVSKTQNFHNEMKRKTIFRGLYVAFSF